MHIPKHYFHDRTVLVLLGLNSILVLFAVLFVVLHVDPAKSSTQIVQYRSNLGIGAFKTGSLADFQLLALFAALQYVFSWILSMRLYVHRRHLAIALLALTTFILIVTPVVSDALLRVN